MHNSAHRQRTWFLRSVRRSASVDTDPLLSAPDETDPSRILMLSFYPRLPVRFSRAWNPMLKENVNGNRYCEILQYYKRLWLYRAGRRSQGCVRSRVCGRSGGLALALGRPAGVVRHPGRRQRLQGHQSQGHLSLFVCERRSRRRFVNEPNTKEASMTDPSSSRTGSSAHDRENSRNKASAFFKEKANRNVATYQQMET